MGGYPQANNTKAHQLDPESQRPVMLMQAIHNPQSTHPPSIMNIDGVMMESLLQVDLSNSLILQPPHHFPFSTPRMVSSVGPGSARMKLLRACQRLACSISSRFQPWETKRNHLDIASFCQAAGWSFSLVLALVIIIPR